MFILTKENREYNLMECFIKKYNENKYTITYKKDTIKIQQQWQK